MDTKYREIWLTKNEVDFCNKFLNEIILGKDTTFTWTVDFDNGYEMDIKLCGADGEVAWTEAVLFKNCCEVGCTDCMDEILGEWIIEHDNVRYITNVVHNSI